MMDGKIPAEFRQTDWRWTDDYGRIENVRRPGSNEERGNPIDLVTTHAGSGRNT
jgi:hypothetical protein